MLKVHNLTPDHFFRHYKLSSNKATLISDFCWKLGIAFSFDEESNLCEVELPNDDKVNMSCNILYDIDWDYLKKNTNKKLIITHRIIYNLDYYRSTLTQIVKEFGLQDRVYWLTCNPYEITYTSTNFKLLYLDSLTLVFCEAHIAHRSEVLRNRVNSQEYSFEYSPSNEEVTKYFISCSLATKAHRLLSTYLITNKIDSNKGVITFHGIEYDMSQFDYLLSEKDRILSLNIDMGKVIDFRNFRGEVIDNVPRPFLASYKESFIKKIESTLVSYVQEATSNENEIFITEKIWQNYLMGRPFILNGCKGTLQYLTRYHGFRSFDSIFDESYDMMDNFVDRAYYGVEELSKFCDLSFEEAQLKVNSIQHILDHNKKVFNSINHRKIFLRIFDAV